MTPDDGFLSRWSRRKLNSRKGGELGPTPSALPVAGGDAPENFAAQPPETREPPAELIAEATAALPRIDDLTAETDLIPFLRAGVPAVLRKAALRRMWSLDPAIRDFVGEARDYSYDWNVAGGVPVSGPLLPGDDVEATLGRMFSRPYAPEQEGGDSVAAEPPGAEVEPAGLAQPGSDEDAAEAAPLSARRQDEEVAPFRAPETVRMGDDDDVATAGPASPAPPSGAIRPRRHGAAEPKVGLIPTL